MSALYIIMGPAGSGKTTIAKAFSDRMDWVMVEGDAHHPQENVDKQTRGEPLTDADRAKWLDSMVSHINATQTDSIVLACSALTPYVQNRLLNEIQRPCRWILLDVPRDVLDARLNARKDHFMPATLLEDQLSALSPPDDALWINADQTVSAICDDICATLGLAQNV